MLYDRMFKERYIGYVPSPLCVRQVLSCVGFVKKSLCLKWKEEAYLVTEQAPQRRVGCQGPHQGDAVLHSGARTAVAVRQPAVTCNSPSLIYHMCLSLLVYSGHVKIIHILIPKTRLSKDSDHSLLNIRDLNQPVLLCRYCLELNPSGPINPHLERSICIYTDQS